MLEFHAAEAYGHVRSRLGRWLLNIHEEKLK